jgi:hypothetical protein
LLSEAETVTGMYDFFNNHPAIIKIEKKYKIINKAFNLAKDYYPATSIR